VVNGQALTFDLLGLYLDVFLMEDRQTSSIWAHLDGKASRGPLAGERLTFIPLPQMTWTDWLAEHPGTLVMDRDTPWRSTYRAITIGRPGRGEDLYGDRRLPSNALVVGVEVDGEFSGFPVAVLAEQNGVANEVMAGEPIVVIAGAGTGIAFERTVDGRMLTFERIAGDGPTRLADIETRTTWNLSGEAIAGPLAGAQLNFVTSFISEWYGWSAYHPETALYTGAP
jgi:hypothetical protein